VSDGPLRDALMFYPTIAGWIWEIVCDFATWLGEAAGDVAASLDEQPRPHARPDAQKRGP
jgi:hypothetical protein